MRGDLHLFNRVRELMAAACICCSKNGVATGFTLCKGSGLLDSQLAIGRPTTHSSINPPSAYWPCIPWNMGNEYHGTVS